MFAVKIAGIMNERFPNIQPSMENSNAEIGKSVVEANTPRFDFTIAGQKYNVLEALRSKKTSRDFTAPDSEWKQGDEYAVAWLDRFEQGGLDDRLYQKTMPKFFEWAAKKDGGYDEDFFAVAERVFDSTYFTMQIGGGRYYGEDNLLKLKHMQGEDRAIFYARAYGKLEGIKQMVWDDPAMAEQKQQLVDAARNSILVRSEENNSSHPLRMAHLRMARPPQSD